MADFAAILRKNIEKLGDTTPDVREKIYGKAREALERKIAAIDPAPAQAVVDRQFEKLSEAVSEVEAEYATPLTLEEQLDDLDSLLSGESDAAPEPVVEDSPVSDVADEPVGDVIAPEPAVDEHIPSEAVSEEADVAADEVTPPLVPTEAEASPLAEEPVMPAVDEDPLRTFLEENVEALSTPEIEVPEVGSELDAPAFNAEDGLSVVAPELDDATTAMAPPEPSGPAWGRLGVLVLILLILGGGGYFASTLPQVQTVLGLNASNSADGDADVPVREVSTTTIDAGDETVEPDTGTLQDGETAITVEGEGAETVVVGTSPDATPKFTQRLTEDGVEVDEGPASGAASVGEGTSVSDLTPGTEAETPPAAEGETGAEEAAVENSNPLRVGQRAIFYEERTGTEAGTAVPGDIIWTQVQESPGDGLSLEPAIRGDVAISDLGLNLTMTIRRNGDPTFPASHIIELAFDVPEDFTGRGIADVQRVTFKGSEEDPGTGLIGIFAPIDTNFFLVALNSAEEAVASNTALMQRESWIDIPLQYVSGRRALVSVEKGTPGERVFEEVFAFWGANPLPVEG
ncbi:MAG: hypothetical protein AAFR39_01005 [Pseudomonadota bacterium]